MICEDVQARLTDALLGEAPPFVREELLDHAAGCAVCAGAAEELRQTLDLLRASSWPAEAVLGEAERRRLFERARTRRVPVRWLAVAASLLAAAAAGAVGVPALRRLWVEPPSPVPAPAPVTVARAADPLPPSRPRVPVVAMPVPTRSAVPTATPVPPPAAPPETAAAAAPAAARKPTPEGVAADGESFLARARAEAEARRPGASSAETRAAPVAGDGRAPSGPLPSPRTALFLEGVGTNGWVATERNALSTFGLDVDTASYALARRSIRRGELPPPGSVRVEDFVNAVDADQPDPGPETFGISVEAAPSPFDGRRAFLRVGIRAKDAASGQRAPAHLVFVVGVSGSTPTELVKRSLRLLVEHLDGRDTIGIVSSGPHAYAVLVPTPASERAVILEAVERLRPERAGSLEAGLQMAYAMARVYDAQSVNRVVLCTDGAVRHDRADPGPLLDQVRMLARGRVQLTALGFGLRSDDEALLLLRLAREGHGEYALVDDLAGAKLVFLRDLAGALPVVARRARAQVEFDPQRVESYRLLGYSTGDVADAGARQQAAGDAGVVIAGQTVAALYELRLSFGEGDIGAVRVRFQRPSGGAAEVQREIGDTPPDGHFEDASSLLQLTVLAARFAEHLQQSRLLPPGERLDDLVRVTQRLSQEALGRQDGEELARLIRDAAGIARRQGRD